MEHRITYYYATQTTVWILRWFFLYLHYAVMAHVEIIVIIAERSAFYAGRSLYSFVALRSPTSDSGRFGFTLKPETVAVDLFQ